MEESCSQSTMLLFFPNDQPLGYIYRSRDFALTIPDPDTVFAVLDRQIPDLEIAQLRSQQASIHQQFVRGTALW